MKKQATALVLALGLLLSVPAQAAMNLLWDIPVDLSEAAYVQAVQEATGIPLVLDEEYDGYSGYWSPDGMDITLYDAPAQLRLSFERGKLLSANLNMDTTEFAHVNTRVEAINVLLDYQQALVEALSAKFGPPTGGYMQTNEGSLQSVSYEVLIWDYPGGQDGRLNSGQTDAMIAAEWRVLLSVFWDNVELNITWDDRFWSDPNGPAPMSAYVDYAFDGNWAHPNAAGFVWGQRYPGGGTENTDDDATSAAPAQVQHVLWDIPIDQDEASFARAVQQERGVTLTASGRSAEDEDIALFGKPVTLQVNYAKGEQSSAKLSVFEQYTEGNRLDDPGRMQAKNEFLDYHQTLVEALSAKYGPPTAGLLDTDESAEGGVRWDYPGSPDGTLDRDLMDSIIAEEGYCRIMVWWDNVLLSIELETTGVQNLYASVNYFYGDHSTGISGFVHDGAYGLSMRELTF